MPTTNHPISTRRIAHAITRRSALAVGALSLAALLAGCSGTASDTSEAAASVQPVNVVFAIGSGARANTPALDSLPTQLSQAVETCVETGGYFDVITIDGDPRPLGAALLASDAKTESRRASENLETTQAACQLLLSQQATEPEADVYAALATAAADLRSMPTFDEGINNIYLVDSCLGTMGVLNYTGDSTQLTLASDPTEVAAFARETEALDLSNTTVHVLFAGEVAAPQQNLAPADKANLTSALATIVTDAGGTIDISDAQLPAASTASSDASRTADLPTVSTCPVSSAPVFQGGIAGTSTTELVLDESVGVSFTPDTAAFADPARAEETIAAASQAICQSGAAVVVTGSCASADAPENRAALAQARAQTVAQALVTAGVPTEQIADVTYAPDGFVSDRTSDGSLDEAAAAINRAVRITVA